MTQYLIRRILWLIPVLFTVSVITFVIMHATPGGPFDIDPTKTDPRVVDKLMASFGLDKPLFLNTDEFQQQRSAGKNILEAAPALLDGQFEIYIWNLLHGDLGPSYRLRGRQVNDVLFEAPSGKPIWQSKVGTTATLGILALTLALLIGIPIGVISALKQNTMTDYVSLMIITVAYGIPNFVMGIFLIIIFAVWLSLINVIEIDYWTRWQAWILPTIALSIPTAAFLARLTRSSVLEVMRQDYIRTARAKGLAERVIVIRHMLRNAFIPVATVIGPALAGLVTGSFVIEYQFGVGGIGQLFVQSISRRDYTIIMALTLLYAFLVAVANIGVDIVYGFLDPRIQVGKSEG